MLIHPLLKLPNCVFKQQPHILQLSEALGSVFSLFKELMALSAYCHFHSFLIFQKFRNQVQTKVTRAILSRNQSAGVSNLQRGRSCEQIFDSSTNSLYGKRTVGFFLSLCVREALTLLLLSSKPIWRKTPSDFFAVQFVLQNDHDTSIIALITHIVKRKCI